MPDKFIIHGATFNGDGTASNEAASAGAAGAWNNIGVLTGAALGFGTLVAGDKVFIRSKTSAGADITVTPVASVNYGSTAATNAGWITWILDGGTVWPGVAGTMTYNLGSGIIAVVRNYNRISAYAQDKWAVVKTAQASNEATFGGQFYQAHNLLIDLSAANQPHGAQIGPLGSGTILDSVHIKSHTRYGNLIGCAQYEVATLINPWIELLNPGETDPVFAPRLYGATISVFGGRITGAGATTGVPLVNTQGGNFRSVGLEVPLAMLVYGGTPPQQSSITCMAMDGMLGSAIYENWGSADSRNDGNYPFLGAALPDSISTPWSWKLYPPNASQQFPARLSNAKLFTDTAAVKTITQELQIATLFTGFDADKLWMSVTYVDNATGEMRSVTSRTGAGGALASSSAAWSAATYGPVALTKYKLAVTTPTAIKKDTLVTAVLFCAKASDNANHILFVEPDLTLS